MDNQIEHKTESEMEAGIIGVLSLLGLGLLKIRGPFIMRTIAFWV